MSRESRTTAKKTFCVRAKPRRAVPWVYVLPHDACLPKDESSIRAVSFCASSFLIRQTLSVQRKLVNSPFHSPQNNSRCAGGRGPSNVPGQPASRPCRLLDHRLSDNPSPHSRVCSATQAVSSPLPKPHAILTPIGRRRAGGSLRHSRSFSGSRRLSRTLFQRIHPAFSTNTYTKSEFSHSPCRGFALFSSRIVTNGWKLGKQRGQDRPRLWWRLCLAQPTSRWQLMHAHFHSRR